MDIGWWFWMRNVVSRERERVSECVDITVGEGDG